MKSLRELDDATLIGACEIFIKGKGVGPVTDYVNAELRARQIDYEFKRSQVYQLVKMAKRRKFFSLSPPREMITQQKIARCYHVPESSIHVVKTSPLEYVASHAADVVAGLIDQLGQQKKHVRIGLGGGWTSMLISSELAVRLRGATNPPKLTLHAMNSGFDVHRPQTAPSSFFGFFEGFGLDIDYVGLFVSPVVDTADYKKTISRRGVRESFALRKELDIVVTSLGSASHALGDFNKFMSHGRTYDKPGGLRMLRRAGWIGDVQYRPFSSSGPILDDPGIRSVALLELNELHAMASEKQPGRHVVVVAGPCKHCSHPRSDAVLPLLQEPSLRVWTHLVMDHKTAGHLVPPEGGGKVEPPPPPPDSLCGRRAS